MTGPMYGQNDPTRAAWQPQQDVYPPPGAGDQYQNQYYNPGAQYPMPTQQPAPRRSRTALWLLLGAVVGLLLGVLGSLLVGALASEETPTELTRESRPALAIPDDVDAGVTDRITFTESGTIGVVGVTVNISHPVPNDLSVELVSPSGQRVVLDEVAGPGANLVEGSAWSDQFAGEPIRGTWQLVVIDSVAVDTGSLDYWRVDITPATS